MKKFIITLIMLSSVIITRAYDAEINGIYYNLDKSSLNAEVTSSPTDKPYAGDIIIPETVVFESTEYVVSSIADNAFFFCTELLSISIGDNVKEIGTTAFDSCDKLSIVSFGKGLKKIGKMAFGSCAGIQTLILPDALESIEESAFSNCKGLATVSLPNGLIQLGGSAFYYCSALESINIPSGITEIGNMTFMGCVNMTSVSFPTGLRSIGEHAFRHCVKLQSLNFPSNVTTIGDGAFCECEGLTTLIIPTGVAAIGVQSFANCFNLKKIYLPGSITSVGKMGFYSMGIIYGGDFYCFATEVPTAEDMAFYVPSFRHKGTLHVPADSIDKYSKASQWKDFANIVALSDEDQYPSGISPILINDNPKSSVIYGLDGQRLYKPKKGINIINGRKVAIK